MTTPSPPRQCDLGHILIPVKARVKGVGIGLSRCSSRFRTDPIAGRPYSAPGLPLGFDRAHSIRYKLIEMAKLDARAEGLLQSFTQEIRDLYGDDLIAVILYGSAVGPEWVPGVSDLNVLIVLREVGPDQLARAAKSMPRWQKSRINPLFLDPEYIESSLDSFPIEFLEMKEHHRVLWGEDPLEGLEVSQENLRLQCEQELKGKWLRLRQAYLEAGGEPKHLRRLLISSLSSFVVIMGMLLRLKGFIPPPREFLETLAQVEETFGLELDSFRRTYQLKQGYASLSRGELLSLFAQYLEEVRRLAQAADRLFKREG